MKINWKVRIRNPLFWATAIPAVVGMIYTVLGALGVVPSLEEDAVLGFFGMIVSVLTSIGVLVDPTTKGFDDSDLAMTYDEPRDDGEEE